MSHDQLDANKLFSFTIFHLFLIIDWLCLNKQQLSSHIVSSSCCNRIEMIVMVQLPADFITRFGVVDEWKELTKKGNVGQFWSAQQVFGWPPWRDFPSNIFSFHVSRRIRVSFVNEWDISQRGHRSFVILIQHFLFHISLLTVAALFICDLADASSCLATFSSICC